MGFRFARTNTAASTGVGFDLLAGFLGEVRELVRTQQHLFAFSDVSETCFEVSRHVLLHLTFADHLVHTAGLLDGEELLPCLGSDRSGQVFEVIRTRSGVNDLVEMCLFLEQELLVAGDTLGEIHRTLVGDIKRRNGDLIHACQSSRHRLGLRAEEVHIRVEDGHVESAGLGADVHLSSVAESGGEDRVFVCLNDLCPQQTTSAELSNLHEIVTADTHVETDSVGCAVVRDSCLGKHRHVLGTPSEGVSQFLRSVRAGVIEDDAVDAYYAVTRQRLGCFDGLRDLLRYLLTRQSFALEEHVLDRVHVDGTNHVLHIVAHSAVVAHEDVRELRRCARTDGEVDGDAVGGDAVQQGLDEMIRQFVFVQAETEGRDTFVEHLQRLGVRLAGVLARADVLTDSPVVVRAGAAYVRELAGRGDGRLQAFEVLAAVERLDAEAFRRAPHELLVKVRTFQIGNDLVLPNLL